MPESAFKFEAGVYRSIVSRISLTLPRIGNEQVVSVREAVVYRRADGQTARRPHRISCSCPTASARA